MTEVVLVTDNGPDPDDAKAILIAATLHIRGDIRLLGVVANGGGHALERAKLSRAILDNAGAESVPVGVGSTGRFTTPNDYEFALEGYEKVAVEALRDGAELLDTAIRTSAERGLHLVLISSLRDAADAIVRDPELFKRKVRTVAIMGGIKRSESSHSGWEPDTSSNNMFDMEAAATVYDFCILEGVRMNIVGRRATPPLPMAIANFFAADAEASPIIKYLARAQNDGLRCLWKKLFSGELPARCTKEWYFETFCDVPPAAFHRRGLDALTVEDDIVPHLNGSVRPYDVVTLMTVLPKFESLFVGSLTTINGSPHILCLDEAGMVNGSSVSRLMHDTFLRLDKLPLAKMRVGKCAGV